MRLFATSGGKPPFPLVLFGKRNLQSIPFFSPLALSVDKLHRAYVLLRGALNVQALLVLALACRVVPVTKRTRSFVEPFVTQVPTNETERQLLDLMANYQLDMGAGFHRTTNQLFTALSACFPLFYLLGGLNNIYCLKKKVDAG